MSELVRTMENLEYEAKRTNDPVIKNMARGANIGTTAGWIITGLATAGYICYKAIGGTDDPSMGHYISAAMCSGLAGLCVGAFGMVPGVITGTAIGAAKGGIEKVVQRYRN